MTGTTNVSPPAGTTTIDSDLKIEVEILALAALRRIASDIARRIEGLIRDKNPRPLIVIIREDHLDDITKSRALSIQLRYLDGAINAAKSALSKITGQTSTITESHDTNLEEPVTPFVSSTTAVVQAVTNLLAFFRADTEYKGRTIPLDETALHPAIGGQLLALGIEAALPNGVSLVEEDPIHRQIGSVLKARADLASIESYGRQKGASRCRHTSGRLADRDHRQARWRVPTAEIVDGGQTRCVVRRGEFEPTRSDG